MQLLPERVGDKWILNGEKRWIGGSGTADVVLFARDICGWQGEMLSFVRELPGYHAEPIPLRLLFVVSAMAILHEECRGFRFRPFGKYQWFLVM